MARSSRGRGRTSSRKREKVDWVVNADSYGVSYVLPNATLIAHALTVPKFWGSYVDPTQAVARGLYEYPEQAQGQVVRAVRGSVSIVPSVWAAGDAFEGMMRLCIKPIEYDTAGVPIWIEDPNYSLVVPQFANEQFLWQKHFRQRFDLGGVGEVHNIAWSGRRMLREDEALWLYIQNTTGVSSQTLSGRIYLRTLMRADE